MTFDNQHSPVDYSPFGGDGYGNNHYEKMEEKVGLYFLLVRGFVNGGRSNHVSPAERALPRHYPARRNWIVVTLDGFDIYESHEETVLTFVRMVRFLKKLSRQE